MKSMIPFFLIVGCLSTVYAQYENGGVITGYEGYVECRSGLLIINGGGADRINITHSACLEIWSTTHFKAGEGGIWDLFVYGNSRTDYYNGETEELTLWGNAIVKLYGGRIDFITSYQKVFDVIVGWDKQGKPIFNTHIEMFVRDYKYNPATMRITGTWEDYTTFNIKLLDQSSDPRYDPAIDNIKFTIIPEPASLILLALGGLTVWKKRLFV